MSQTTIEYEVEIIFDPYAQGEDSEPFYEGAIYLTIEVEGNVSKYVPARTYGPPEDCYPEEGGEVDITDFRAIKAKSACPTDPPIDVSGVTSGDIEWLLSEFDTQKITDALVEADLDDGRDHYDEWRDMEQDDYWD